MGILSRLFGRDDDARPDPVPGGSRPTGSEPAEEADSAWSFPPARVAGAEPPADLLARCDLSDRTVHPWVELPGPGIVWLIPVDANEAARAWASIDTDPAHSGVVLGVNGGFPQDFFGIGSDEPDGDDWSAEVDRAVSMSHADAIAEARDRVRQDIATGEPGATEITEPDPFPSGLLAVVADPRAWLMPVWLDYLGMSNLGLDPAVLSVALRSWEERFGARLRVLDEASAVIDVAHPPTEDAVALDVAAEHATIAPDQLEPGTLWDWVPTVRSCAWPMWWD